MMTPRVVPLHVCTLAILLSLYLCGVHSALTDDPTRHCAAACARHLHNVVAHLHTQLQLLLLRVLLCHRSLRPTHVPFLLNQRLCQVNHSPTATQDRLSTAIVCGYWFVKKKGVVQGWEATKAGANVLISNGGTRSEHIFAINQSFANRPAYIKVCPHERLFPIECLENL